MLRLAPTLTAAALLLPTPAKARDHPVRSDEIRVGIGVPVDLVSTRSMLEALGYTAHDLAPTTVEVPIALPSGLRLLPAAGYGRIQQGEDRFRVRRELSLGGLWTWPIGAMASGGAGARVGTETLRTAYEREEDAQTRRSLGVLAVAEAWPTRSLALG